MTCFTQKSILTDNLFFSNKHFIIRLAIYRVWILVTSYLFLVLVGKSWGDAVGPALALNVLYSIGYYT